MSSENIHYENAGVNGSYYLLSIDYNETGPLEIEVTFSNNVCSKTTAIQYNSKSLLDHNIVSNSMIIFYIVSNILISVELNSTSFLIISNH